MSALLSDILQKLGVQTVLSPYETCPWSVSDAAGKTCSAEVRMNPDGDEIEAELQIFYDEPQAGQPSVEQILWLKGTPQTKDKWAIDQVRLKRDDVTTKIYAADEKASAFFRACVVELEQGKMPDIEALIEREMNKTERTSGSRGSGGGKSPKIRPQQVLDMKQGKGF